MGLLFYYFSISITPCLLLVILFFWFSSVLKFVFLHITLKTNYMSTCFHLNTDIFKYALIYILFLTLFYILTISHRF